jgi:hypothetical protein
VARTLLFFKSIHKGKTEEEMFLLLVVVVVDQRGSTTTNNNEAVLQLLLQMINSTQTFRGSNNVSVARSLKILFVLNAA